MIPIERTCIKSVFILSMIDDYYTGIDTFFSVNTLNGYSLAGITEHVLWSEIWRGTPTEKDDPDPVVADSDPLVASSVRVFCARNSQWEGRSLPRQGRDYLSQLDVGICVGFSTETTGSKRNPKTWRTPPSYVYKSSSADLKPDSHYFGLWVYFCCIE